MSLGACCSSTPGLGGMGPEGACALAGMPAGTITSRTAMDIPTIRFIPSTWQHQPKPFDSSQGKPALRECTSFDACSTEGVAAGLRDSYNQSSSLGTEHPCTMAR